MIEITRERFTLRMTADTKKVTDPMEAWQRARRLLDGYGRGDHFAEVNCRVNNTGYILWFFEVRGPQPYMEYTFSMPNAWGDWEGIERKFIEWLANHLPNGCLPPEILGWEFNMRKIGTQ